MKLPSILVLITLLNVANPLRADCLVQPNDVIGIAGDSITEMQIYSAFIEDYLLMCQPTDGQKIIQFGWGGEQASGFLARLNNDVLPFKPTVMTTCYGMNDGNYQAINHEVANTYRTTQTAIVEAFKKNGVRIIVLGSSKCVDTFTFHNDPAAAAVYNKTLGALADIDKDIAQKEGVPYADVYGATLDVMQKAKAKFGQNYAFGGGDGIHPGSCGHLVMAYAFLKALGCDGNIGTITVEPALNRAEATSGHEVVSYQDGTVTVKSSRYPFCFSGDLNDQDLNTNAAMTQFFPFNQDLNRFMLVVKGITGSKVKVTWGGTTKEYTADQLMQGINLASEFLQNPFVDQFNKVHNAVETQKVQEALLSKTFMHNLAGWKASFAPGVDSAWDQILASAMKQHDALCQNAAALVLPITHTIKIEQEP